MDKHPNRPQRLTDGPSISVSPWYQQQPTEFSNRYDVVLVQPGHSEERQQHDAIDNDEILAPSASDRRNFHWEVSSNPYQTEIVSVQSFHSGQRYDYNDNDEMLVPPREDQRRPRWDMVSNPYQTQRFGHNDSQGYLQYPQSSSANVSTNSNNILLVPQGSSYSQSVSNEHFEDYTAMSWLTLVFCCLFLGIVALWLARDAKTSLRLGRREEALEKARNSRNLNLAGIIIGPLIYVVVMVNVLRNRTVLIILKNIWISVVPLLIRRGVPIGVCFVFVLLILYNLDVLL